MWIVSFGEYPTKVGRKVPGTAATPNESARLGAPKFTAVCFESGSWTRRAHMCGHPNLLLFASRMLVRSRMPGNHTDSHVPQLSTLPVAHARLRAAGGSHACSYTELTSYVSPESAMELDARRLEGRHE